MPENYANLIDALKIKTGTSNIKANNTTLADLVIGYNDGNLYIWSDD